EARRQAAADAERARSEAVDVLAAANEDHARAGQQIEGLEAEVEQARARVFAAANTATTLRHAIEHAAQQQERVGETLAKLEVEEADLRREREQVARERGAADAALARVQQALERVCLERAAQE